MDPIVNIFLANQNTKTDTMEKEIVSKLSIVISISIFYSKLLFRLLE